MNINFDIEDGNSSVELIPRWSTDERPDGKRLCFADDNKLVRGLKTFALFGGLIVVQSVAQCLTDKLWFKIIDKSIPDVSDYEDNQRKRDK